MPYPLSFHSIDKFLFVLWKVHPIIKLNFLQVFLTSSEMRLRNVLIFTDSKRFSPRISLHNSLILPVILPYNRWLKPRRMNKLTFLIHSLIFFLLPEDYLPT